MKQSDVLHLGWDILTTGCVTILAIFIPLNIIYALVPNFWGVMINLGISLLFLADIFVTIRKIKAGSTNVSFGEPGSIRKYLRGTFVFDVLAVIPFSLIPGWEVYALLRLTKFVRVGQIMYLWRHLLYQLQNQVSLIIILYWLFLSMHGLACGWLSLLSIDADHELNGVESYVDALYWTSMTITGVGYGDITPDSVPEKIYAIFTMIVGLIFFGYMVGYVAGILTKVDPAKTVYLENLERLSQTVKHRDLPLELQTRIYDYYTYIWRKRLGYFEEDFLGGLPEGLRKEVSMYLKKDIVEKVPILREGNEQFLEEVSMLLNTRVLTPGEFVFKAGDEGHEMFFVVRGELNVLHADGSKIAQLSEGDFFGEISLFLSSPRTAGIQAISYCDLYYISKQSMDFVVQKFPEIGERIQRKLEARVARDKERQQLERP